MASIHGASAPRVHGAERITAYSKTFARSIAKAAEPMAAREFIRSFGSARLWSPPSGPQDAARRYTVRFTADATKPQLNLDTPILQPPNLLSRQYDAHAVDAVWLADITYLWTQEGWLYLAVLLDLGSRRIVGWSLSERVDQELTLQALLMALNSGRRPGAPPQ